MQVGIDRVDACLSMPQYSLKEKTIFLIWMIFISVAPSLSTSGCQRLNQRAKDMWLSPRVLLCLLSLHWSARYSTPLYMTHTRGHASLHPHTLVCTGCHRDYTCMWTSRPLGARCLFFFYNESQIYFIYHSTWPACVTWGSVVMKQFFKFALK